MKAHVPFYLQVTFDYISQRPDRTLKGDVRDQSDSVTMLNRIIVTHLLNILYKSLYFKLFRKTYLLFMLRDVPLE